MSSRFPPPKFPPVNKPPPEPKSGNALWRLESWFPDLSEGVLKSLKTYHEELLKFNAKVNLISRSTEREADEVHFADCVMAGQLLLQRPLPGKIFDIGSGNGLPGLVMAIMDSKCEYFLVESDSRKAEFLKHIIHLLELKNANVMNVRFESLRTAGVQVALSRGFASISKTVLACNKVFNVGGQFFHLKGNNWSTEIAELPSQLISVWKPELVGEYVLPTSQARRAVVSTQKNM